MKYPAAGSSFGSHRTQSEPLTAVMSVETGVFAELWSAWPNVRVWAAWGSGTVAAAGHWPWMLAWNAMPGINSALMMPSRQIRSPASARAACAPRPAGTTASVPAAASAETSLPVRISPEKR